MPACAAGMVIAAVILNFFLSEHFYDVGIFAKPRTGGEGVLRESSPAVPVSALSDALAGQRQKGDEADVVYHGAWECSRIHECAGDGAGSDHGNDGSGADTRKKNGGRRAFICPA